LEQILGLLTQGASNKTVAIVEIIFMLTVAFIIGVLMIWFYHKVRMMLVTKKMNRLNADLLLHQEECRRVKSERDKINFSYKSLTEDNNKLMSEHKQLKKETEKIREQLHSERQKPLMSAGHHREEIKKLGVINERLENEVRDLSKQAQRLKDDNDYLKTQGKGKYTDELKDIKQDFQSERQKHSNELRDIRQELQKIKIERERSAKELDVALLNSQILKEENEKIKGERDKLRIENDRIRVGDEILKDKIKVEHKKLEAKEEEFERKKQLLLESIGVVEESEKEDLRQIRGIGPFIEKKLHKIGVYTIRQIANFTKEDISRATDLIKYFPGRIERDQWIFQAKEMMRVRDKNLELIKKFE
jgi:predicted flap endonuclease-1-like 5' DNA nuclease/predicted  nucleic acid-binding Zn-ribbon protein